MHHDRSRFRCPSSMTLLVYLQCKRPSRSSRRAANLILSCPSLPSSVCRPSQDVFCLSLFPLRPCCLPDENSRRPKLPSQRAYSNRYRRYSPPPQKFLTFCPSELTHATIARYKWRSDVRVCEDGAGNIGLRSRSLSYGYSLVR